MTATTVVQVVVAQRNTSLEATTKDLREQLATVPIQLLTTAMANTAMREVTA
jgi:hypothetical protein